VLGEHEKQAVICASRKYIALENQEKDWWRTIEARKFSLALKGLPITLKRWSLRKLKYCYFLKLMKSDGLLIGFWDK